MSADFANAIIQWGSAPESITLLQLMKDLTGVTDASKDTEYSMYLQMAGEACEIYVDNKLADQAATERFAWLHKPIALRYWPVSALTLVEIEGSDETAGWTSYVQDGITWINTSATARECGDSFSQVDVTYQAGYDPLPADLGYAITRAAIGYSEDSAAGGQVKKESIVGVGSIEYSTSADSMGTIGLLTPAVTGTLDRYRRLHA